MLRGMSSSSSRFAWVLACLASAVGCVDVAGSVDDRVDDRVAAGAAEQAIIVGSNDLIPVAGDGSNLPAELRPRIDGIGVLSMGCTATYLGQGIAISAGHCFGATDVRQDDVACGSTTVRWGVRKDHPAWLQSRCTNVLAMQRTANFDYAIFEITPAPPESLAVPFSNTVHPAVAHTLLSHPQMRPLESSQTCEVSAPTATKVSHTCDTQLGSDGAVLLELGSAKAVAIHTGSAAGLNVATKLKATPLCEFIGPPCS